ACVVSLCVLHPTVSSPVAVLLLPRLLPASAPTPTAVLLLPVVLLTSASEPVAVFWVPVVLLPSAKSPRNVLLRLMSQPCRQAARPCGERANIATATAMRTGR